MTDRPFAINLILAWPQEERLALEEGVPIVSFSWDAAAPDQAGVRTSFAA